MIGVFDPRDQTPRCQVVGQSLHRLPAEAEGPGDLGHRPGGVWGCEHRRYAHSGAGEPGVGQQPILDRGEPIGRSSYSVDKAQDGVGGSFHVNKLSL